MCVDRCNFDRGQRKHWIDLAHKYAIPSHEICAIVLDVPLETAIDRVQQRRNHPTLKPGKESIGIVRKFQYLLKMPSLREGFGMIVTMRPRDDSLMSELVMDWLNDTLQTEEGEGGEEKDDDGDGDDDDDDGDDELYVDDTNYVGQLNEMVQRECGHNNSPSSYAFDVQTGLPSVCTGSVTVKGQQFQVQANRIAKRITTKKKLKTYTAFLLLQKIERSVLKDRTAQRWSRLEERTKTTVPLQESLLASCVSTTTTPAATTQLHSPQGETKTNDVVVTNCDAGDSSAIEAKLGQLKIWRDEGLLSEKMYTSKVVQLLAHL